MPAEQQDVHDVFATLLDCSPSLTADENLRSLVLRFASILADLLARIQVLESQSETDLKTLLEKDEALRNTDFARLESRLNTQGRNIREALQAAANHGLLHDNLDLPGLRTDLDKLANIGRMTREHINRHVDQANTDAANHRKLHDDFPLSTIYARLAGLDANCASLAPLLPLLPLPTPATTHFLPLAKVAEGPSGSREEEPS